MRRCVLVRRRIIVVEEARDSCETHTHTHTHTQTPTKTHRPQRDEWQLEERHNPLREGMLVHPEALPHVGAVIVPDLVARVRE